MDDEQKQKAYEVGFDQEMVEAIEDAASGEVRVTRLEGLAEKEDVDAATFPGEVAPANEPGAMQLKLDVIMAEMPQQKIDQVVIALQDQLGPRGVQVMMLARPGTFESTFGAISRADENAVVVGFFLAETPFPMLLIRQTNGANYDIGPGDIIARLREWQAQCDYRILGAGFDWVDIKFEDLPDDVDDFAEDIYDICPDTIDQGAFPEPDEEPDFDDMTEDEIMEFYGEALDNADTGALARYLQRERRLLLWWD